MRLVRSPFVPKTMYLGQYEPIETRFVLGKIGDFETFVNVGANLGWYSVIAGVQGKSVLAFEPDLLNATLLKKNLRLNGVSDFRVLEVAVSNVEGEAQLFGGNSGASLVPGWAGQPQTSRKVPLVTFDSVAALQHQSPFVVIDVEGHELPVIQGMQKHLEVWEKAILMVEITNDQHHPSGSNPDRASTFNLMHELGYESWYLDPYTGSLKPYSDTRIQNVGCTYVFAKFPLIF